MQFFKECPMEINHNHWFITEYCSSESQKSSLWFAWRKWQMENIKLKPHYLIYEGDFTGWQLEVVRWKNLHTRNQNKYKHKTPQLYLHGPADSGKTTFIKLIFNGYEHQTFIPIRGTSSENRRFQWEGYSEHLHNFVYFDEFKFSEVTINDWKVLAEGNYFKQDIKFINGGESIRFRCPFVMISNFSPCNPNIVRDEEDRQAIRARILEVKADRQPSDKGPDFELRFCKSENTMHIPLTYAELIQELNNTTSTLSNNNSFSLNNSKVNENPNEKSKSKQKTLLEEFENLFRIFGEQLLN